MRASLLLDFNWRRAAPRFLTGMLLTASVMFLGMNRADPALVERLQAGASDLATPALAFLGQPLAPVKHAMDGLSNFAAVYRRNTVLEEDNRRLLEWRDAALRLEEENTALRAQLHVAPDPAIGEVTARIVGDPAGGFVESRLLAAGTVAGIAKGQPAVVSSGGPGAPKLGALAGRVVQAGENSSRLLLLTDVNSRIPVLLAQSHVHAILAGDDSDRPQLMFLPPDASISVGEPVVTSGNDKLMPPGLAVGVVVSNDETGVRVAPTADLSRLEYVSVLQYEGVNPLPPLEPASPPAAKPRRRP